MIITNASLYHFGVLQSIVHMAWMKAVCSRLEMRYRYSKEVVYNNFPWTNPTEHQKKNIEIAAQKIVDIREQYSNCSFALLYNDSLMPEDLYNAHKKLDRIVMRAYNKSWKTEAKLLLI